MSQYEVRPGGTAPKYDDKKPKAWGIASRMIQTVVSCAIFIALCKLTHFRQKILYDVRINRNFLKMFYIMCLAFTAIFLYLETKFVFMRPRNKRIYVEKWDIVAPYPLYTASGALVLAVISFIFALWPAFKFMTFIIGFFGFTSMLFLLQWLPF